MAAKALGGTSYLEYLPLLGMYSGHLGPPITSTAMATLYF